MHSLPKPAPGRLLPVAALVATVLLALLVLAWLRERDRVLLQFADSAAAALAREAAGLDAVARVGVEDARFLAAAPDVTAAAAGEPGAAATVSRLFLAYAAARRDMFQVRLLALDGTEQIRIDRRGDEIAAAAELQSKGDRPYFQEAVRLAAGEVHVSPLDLNVEHGVIERPLRPTLRFAAPVFSATGARAGVLVLNLEATPLLDRVAGARARLAGEVVLVDARGSYLSHPDPAKEWGGPELLATGAGLEADHPALAGWALGPLSAPRTLHEGGLVAARAGVEGSLGIRLLVVATEGEALLAQSRELLPFATGSAAVTLLAGIGLLALAERRRLAAKLAREHELRTELTAREKGLREAQERLVASARLAALAESAAALAHELRNPLGAIMQSAALLRDDVGLGAEPRQLLEIVRSESERLERAVAEFLSLARPPTPRLLRVDLGSSVREVVALARHEPSFGGVVTIGEAVSADAPEVLADPDEIRQILWNLLLNGGAASRRAGGSALTVRVRRAELEGLAATALEVVDEGDGPPESGGRAAAPGSGLGLIVVAGIAARRGGRFEIVAREESTGSCARVVLPAAPAELVGAVLPGTAVRGGRAWP